MVINKLNRNRYMVENTIAEVCQSYDDPYRLVGWLIGKKTGHLIIHVIKGDKSRLLLVGDDVGAFQKQLLETMSSL